MDSESELFVGADGAAAVDVVGGGGGVSGVGVVGVGCRFGDKIWALSRSRSLPGLKDSNRASTLSSVGPQR